MKRILITGGTGFVGRSMLDYRLRHEQCADAEWIIVSRNPGVFYQACPQFLNMPGVCIVAGDVLHEAVLANDEKIGKVDAIIHAAAVLDPSAAEDRILSAAIDGTRHVLSLAKRVGCNKILFTSSGAVYGNCTSPSSENDECRPSTPYGKGKMAAERLLVESGLDVKLARCFSFTGKYLDRKIYYAIGNFIQNCLDGKPIIINGDGTPLRSYLYADDLVEWLFAILERGETGRPYNVGSDYAVSIRELAETVRSTLGSNGEIIVKGKSEPDAKPSVYVPDISRAQGELDLKVSVALEQAIVLSQIDESIHPSTTRKGEKCQKSY